MRGELVILVITGIVCAIPIFVMAYFTSGPMQDVPERLLREKHLSSFRAARRKRLQKALEESDDWELRITPPRPQLYWGDNPIEAFHSARLAISPTDPPGPAP